MRIRRFFQRRSEDTDLARELEAHIAHQVDENIAAGMSEDEARRQAHLKLGSPQRVREDVWEWNTVSVLDDLWRDFRYVVRTLRRARMASQVSTVLHLPTVVISLYPYHRTSPLPRSPATSPEDSSCWSLTPHPASPRTRRTAPCEWRLFTLRY